VRRSLRSAAQVRRSTGHPRPLHQAHGCLLVQSNLKRIKRAGGRHFADARRTQAGSSVEGMIPGDGPHHTGRLVLRGVLCCLPQPNGVWRKRVGYGLTRRFQYPTPQSQILHPSPLVRVEARRSRATDWAVRCRARL
jgi:hypothetical protein